MTLEPNDVRNARVFSATDLPRGRRVLRVAPTTGEAPAFEPGQYTILGLPDPEREGGVVDSRRQLVRRTYSMSSSAHERSHLELYFVAVEGGRLTPRLRELVEGDPLYMDPRPRGALTLTPVSADSDVVLVATGTAIAPFVSMVRTYRGTGRWRRLAVIHGVRYADELAFGDELARAARDDPTLTYLPVCSRDAGDGASAARRGYVQDRLDADELAAEAGIRLYPGNAHVYLAGNPAMIDDVQRRLAERGFQPDSLRETGTLHTERYW